MSRSLASPSNPALGDNGTPPAVAWILRIGLFCCMIGHGNLGLLRTAAWTSYFGVVGIQPDTALGLMPWVGLFDVALGFSVLFAPVRGVIAYMAAWCVWTALLRPLAGESIWEFVERAGNYGVPIALFLFASGGLWAQARFDNAPDESRRRLVAWVLRLTTVLLLVGHGALNWFVAKPLFVSHYGLLGLPGAPTETWVGMFECLLGVAVLLKPARWLLFAVLGWKLATEMLNPMAGSPIWVFIEHGGSYAAPLALAFLLPQTRPAAVIEPAPAN